MIRPPRRTRRRDERGAAAVEMALVLPLLLFLLFGIVDFGLMLNAQITVTSAAREGARAHVLGQDAQNRVEQASEHLDGPVAAAVTSCADGAGQVTVVTTYDYSFITPLAAIAPLLGGSLDSTITLTGRGVMACAQ